jgi:hypothetical protein
MQELEGNRRERSAHSLFSALSVAEGLLCPNCKRAIQIYDFEFIDRSDFRIICSGCHRTLLTYKEQRT